MDLSAFHFLRPWWLLCIPAAVILMWIWRQYTDTRQQWADVIAPHLLDHLMIGGTGTRRWRPIHSTAVALAMGGILAAGPTWEREPPPFTEDKAPMVVALDLSRTMDALDVPPTRLERAKQKVRDLALLRAGSRTGLVVYAGTAHLVLPPAEDPELLGILLAALDTTLMPVPGRFAEAALNMAARLLEKESAGGTILFITDGFEAQHVPAFADHHRRSRDQVLVLAVGTSEGGPLKTKSGRVALDSHGVPLRAYLDRGSFTRLRDEADVPVASVTVDESDVEWVQRRALHHLQVVNERTAEVRWKEFGYYGTFPLAILAALWFRRGWTVRWSAILILVSLWGMAEPVMAEPSGMFDRAYEKSTSFVMDLFLTRDQQGRRYFEREDYAAAAERFADPMWKGLAHYRNRDYASALAQFARLNTAEAYFLMGNCYARMKEYPTAVGAYDHALTLQGAFPEAKANRKLVAALIPKKPHDDQEGEADPNLDPDDIKFDKKGQKGKAGQVPQLKIKPAQVAELWMRNLNVSPAEFLREKFRVQAEKTKQPPRGT